MLDRGKTEASVRAELKEFWEFLLQDALRTVGQDSDFYKLVQWGQNV